MNNIFDAIPEDLSAEVFEKIIDNGSIRIERIISKGHNSPDDGWYDQNHNEWVVVLKGKAILTFENNSTVTLKQGDYLNITAHQKHKVTWTAPDVETVWLAVHYK